MESGTVSIYEDALNKMPNSDNISNGKDSINNLKDNYNIVKKGKISIKAIPIENCQNEPVFSSKYNRSNRSNKLSKFENSKENGNNENSEYSSVNEYMPKFEKELNEPYCKKCKCCIII